MCLHLLTVSVPHERNVKMYLMENIFVILRTTRSEDDLSPLFSDRAP